MTVLFRRARVLTLAGPGGLRRGPAMSDLGILREADVLTDQGRIAQVGERLFAPPHARVIDAAGRVLLPAFVDCHTHACFAGSRLDEWERRLKGESYLDILKAGGGIMSTVRATREAPQLLLTELLVERVRRMAMLGTGTIEVKSGYGLTTTHELKMLRAIVAARPHVACTIVPTALLGHAIDPDVPRETFIRGVIDETLPAVAGEFPGITIDAYCEQGSWNVDETRALVHAALERGCPVRLHVDQFNRSGLVGSGLAFTSVDHLEASSDDDLKALARSGMPGVLLPCSGFHTDRRYAKARQIIDAGGSVGLATNFNPGSAPCGSMPMAIALAVRFNGMTCSEAICATTHNAARVLGFENRGSIEVGKVADLVLLRHTDERELAHEFGDDPIACAMIGGVLTVDPQ